MMSKLLIIILTNFVLITSVSAGDSSGTILVDDFDIENYEEFVLQIRGDLPTGTSFSDVKRYLLENGIHYGYSPAESTIKVMIKKLDSYFFIFRTDLQIKFIISEDENLMEVTSRLVETGL